MKLEIRQIFVLVILSLGQNQVASSLSSSKGLKKLSADHVIEDRFIVSRKLEDEANSGDNDDAYQDDDGTENNFLDKLDFDFFWDALDRVDGDMNEMWQTSPNAWTTEDWEVFGGMMFVILLALSCFCCLCCAPIFLFEDRDQKQVDQYHQLESGANAPANDDKGTKNDDVKSAVSSLSGPSYKHRSSLKKPILEEDPNISIAGTYSTDGSISLPTRKKKKSRRSLWSEVASVWGEFLGDIGTGKNTFSKKYYVDDDDSDYKKLQRGRSRVYNAPVQKKSSKTPKEITTKGEIV